MRLVYALYRSSCDRYESKNMLPARYNSNDFWRCIH